MQNGNCCVAELASRLSMTKHRDKSAKIFFSTRTNWDALDGVMKMSGQMKYWPHCECDGRGALQCHWMLSLCLDIFSPLVKHNF